MSKINTELVLLAEELGIDPHRYGSNMQLSGAINACLYEGKAAMKEAKYRLAVAEHMTNVRINLDTFCSELRMRAVLHDLSKLEEPEFTGFMNAQEGFEQLTAAGHKYGSPEYRAHCKTILPAIKHHQAHNRHHAEYHRDGVKDMTLVDIIEMVSDWKAASDRENNDFNISLEICLEKYVESQELRCMIRNTVLALGWDEGDHDMTPGAPEDAAGVIDWLEKESEDMDVPSVVGIERERIKWQRAAARLLREYSNVEEQTEPGNEPLEPTVESTTEEGQGGHGGEEPHETQADSPGSEAFAGTPGCQPQRP